MQFKNILFIVLISQLIFVYGMEEHITHIESIKPKTTQYLLAQWRSKYSYVPQKPGCNFCNHIKEQKNEDYYVSQVNQDFVVKLNDNPYSLDGSIMVIPNDHLSDIEKLGKSLRKSLGDCLKKVSIILKKLGYKHFSIGLNAGEVAGASMEHLHIHFVLYRDLDLSNRYSNLIDGLEDYDPSDLPDIKAVHRNIKFELENYNSKILANIESENKNDNNCVFCDLINHDNEPNNKHNLIVIRLKHALIMFHPNPLVQGHVIIIPFQHEKEFHLLLQDTLDEILEISAQLTTILPELIRNKGHNIGINIGKQPNGRPDDHISVDLVPRWAGDLSQMLLSNSQLISFNIRDLIIQIRKKIEEKNLIK